MVSGGKSINQSACYFILLCVVRTVHTKKNIISMALKAENQSILGTKKESASPMKAKIQCVHLHKKQGTASFHD